MAIGVAPAVTFLRPSRKIASASTVAVVVPSPATSEVLLATSRTICAPMFWYGSSSSISFATVTPSLVTVGEPHFLSRTTLRPRGPEGDLDRLGQDLNALEDLLAGLSLEKKLLSRHRLEPPSPVASARRQQAPRLDITSWAAWPVRRGSTPAGPGPLNYSMIPRTSSSRRINELLPLDLDLAPCVLAHKDAVTGLDLKLVDLAVLGHLARPTAP